MYFLSNKFSSVPYNLTGTMEATHNSDNIPPEEMSKQAIFSPHPLSADMKGESCPVTGYTLSDGMESPSAAHRPRGIYTVGTRGSQLALIQTQKIVDLLEERNPQLAFHMLPIITTGDKVIDIAISKIGEKDLFTKELEIALAQANIDFVVHSLKDLPAVLPPEMKIGAILKREDARDAVVMKLGFKGGSTLGDLENGSVIGTSSVRRCAQLKKMYPHLVFQDIRGNLNTRLTKLDSPTSPYTAIILAAAGLMRLGWSHRISQILDPTVSFYAVGQGALAVECRADDSKTLRLLSVLNDRDTVLACLAERALLRRLEGGCSVPIGVITNWIADEGEGSRGRKLRVCGRVINLDGKDCIDTEGEGVVDVGTLEEELHVVKKEEKELAEQLGISVAEKLLEAGAGRILDELTRKRDVEATITS